MKVIEIVGLALRNIRGNMLRTILTCLIIAFGIMALVGIQSAISALGGSASEAFSSFGTNQFSITRSSTALAKDEKPNPAITIKEAKAFQENMNYPSKISISRTVKNYIEMKTDSEKTNPTSSIMAVNEHYLSIANQEIETGRAFSKNELEQGMNVAVVASGIKNKLFKNSTNQEVLGKTLQAAGVKYTIIGVLKDKGGNFGSSPTYILVPLENGVKLFGTSRSNYNITVGVETAEDIEPAMTEAYGAMRIARNLKTTDKNNFSIPEPSAANDEIKSLLNNISMGGLLIGIVTLSGAAIGLMNILLVSVTERIREIGISKAIGAKAQDIGAQYFFEGIIISLIGGILGILFGLGVGFALSASLKSKFQVPWLWVGIGLGICILVGLASSIYPAIKASRLNPIEALRQN